MLVTAARPPCRPEAQRPRNTVQQLRRKRSPEAKQYVSLVEVAPGCHRLREQADSRLRHNMGEGHSNRSNAPTQPTNGARQGDIGAAQRIGSGFTLLADDATAMQSSIELSRPGSLAARKSGKRLNVRCPSGQYHRAILSPRGVARA